MDIFIYLPTNYIDPLTKNAEELVDIAKVSVYNSFGGNKSILEWTQTTHSDSSVVLNTAVSKNDPILRNLSAVQTIYFDCSNSEHERCAMRKLNVRDFVAHTSFEITLKFPIDTKKVAEIISQKDQENFVVFTSILVQKTTEANW